jgi:hypothetical protein
LETYAHELKDGAVVNETYVLYAERDPTVRYPKKPFKILRVDTVPEARERIRDLEIIDGKFGKYVWVHLSGDEVRF